MGFLLRGRFAQRMELASILLILLGIICLCQPWTQALFRVGFGILLAGWVGLTVFSHRKPVREVEAVPVAQEPEV